MEYIHGVLASHAQSLLTKPLDDWDTAKLYYAVDGGIYSAWRKYMMESKQYSLKFAETPRKDYEEHITPWCLRYEAEIAKRIAAGVWPAKELAAAVEVARGDNEYDDAEPEIRTFLLGVEWGRNNPK